MAYEYKVMGQTVRLDVDPTVVAVRFHNAQPNSGRARATERAGAGPFAVRFEVPGEELTIIPATAGQPAPQSLRDGQPVGTIRALNAQPEVSHALPVFRVGGNQVVAANRVIIGLDDPAQGETIAG